MIGRAPPPTVFTAAVPADRYRTGPAAARRHTFGVREDDGGAVVASLTVTNTDHRPLLLLAGESILGNRQNRVLNVSVLIAAGSELAVPVSCVEQGRWGAARHAARATELAPARIRATALSTVHDGLGAGGPGRHADQGEVWDEVAAYAVRHDVAAPTMALEDVHAARSRDVRRLVGRTRPVDGQRGVIATAGGQVLGLDLFDKPGTLSRYWSAITGAFALDALTVEDLSFELEGAALAAQVEAFLHATFTADAVAVDGVGDGEELHLRGEGVDAHALVWDDAVVHLAAFPS
jgi:hypothetical protein